MVVAALYVDPRGAYAGIPDVEIWDEARDARGYAGPHPVVAHPPCSRWCRLAGLVEARWGHRRGLDGGKFASALQCVRIFGGVLEHPAYSDAWAAYHLPRPPAEGWQKTACGGWVCHVEQGRYGHPAKKATWLYAHGIGEPPALRWGRVADHETNTVSWCGNHVGPGGWRRSDRRAGNDGAARPRVGKKVAAATPPEFRDVLLSIARSVRGAKGDR